MRATDPISRPRRVLGLLRRALLGLGLAAAAAAAAEAPPPATVRVEGLGLFGDHSMHGTLLLLLGRERGPTLDANAMEDAAMIVFSSVVEQGYVEPVIDLAVTEAGGRTAHYELDPRLDHPLPRPQAATKVVLRVRPGRRFVVAEVTFSGLTALPPDDARRYFIGQNALFLLAAERAYSPARLRRSVANLAEELHRRGYADAQVDADSVRLDHATGAVRVHVAVDQGPLWRVARLEYAPGPGASGPAGVAEGHLGQPWSSLWRQDMETAIRRWYFQRGHPDVTVTVSPHPGPVENGRREVTAVAQVNPGPEVTLGHVRFTGNKVTRDSVLRPLVPAKAGAPLNPIEIENGRFRLSRLGVFRSVTVGYDPEQGTTRDVEYHFVEGLRREFSLLFGYGSYEQFRGGVEMRDYNLFGLAHRDTLELVQSVKSTRAEYDYTVPELFGSSVDGTVKAFGLRRKELSFLREEYGLNTTIVWPVHPLGFDVTTGYTYRRLRNLENSLATEAVDLPQTDAASVDLSLTRDRRDNPLEPRHGYKISAQVEEASRKLGGKVDYQRVQLGFSYHTPWGPSRWIHVGLSHNLLTTLGSPDDSQLPVNERFYPGGDNSIRGYREGEASPRTAAGQFLGAKTTLLLNLELEQALTPKFSLVLFSDSLGMAARMSHYPFDQRLYTVGLGVRYRTLVGPIRLEYGHNLNPRPADPSGTLLFSVGFPF